MRTLAWEIHDTLISTLSSLSAQLLTEITLAEARINLDDELDRGGDLHSVIVKKWTLLQSWRDTAQRVSAWCDWERLERKTKRTGSPWDTQPAVESRYSWALEIKGQVPVSPLRALLELERRLGEAMGRVVEF